MTARKPNAGRRLNDVQVLAYLLYAGLYWLKGVVVALRQRAGRLWLLPFGLCVAFACLLPGLVVHSFFNGSVSQLWAWGLGAAFACFAYNRYYWPRLKVWYRS